MTEPEALKRVDCDDCRDDFYVEEWSKLTLCPECFRIHRLEETIEQLEAQRTSVLAALDALRDQWNTQAAGLEREALEQQSRHDRERKIYCDGKAISLRHAARGVDALLTRWRNGETP